MESNSAFETPIEDWLKMSYLEQFVNKIVDYTQRYNNSISVYYSPHNLIGKYEKYPLYGDFSEAYSFRKYGNWWKRSENNQKNYRPQDNDPLNPEDYVTVQYETAVVPRHVYIYEVFNPGAVIKIWGSHSERDQDKWILLWEGRSICDDKPTARKFAPVIRRINSLINTLRIEFNHDHLCYHTSIEAVLLAGYEPFTKLQYGVISNGLLTQFVKNLKITPEKFSTTTEEKDYFEDLPYEVILNIFQYLDLVSLSRCARVNKRWNEVANDSFIYQDLNLKPYWHLVDCEAIQYFIRKCKGLRKLDLSWCGSYKKGFIKAVADLIGKNCESLTHISLGNCKFVNAEIISKLMRCKELVELRMNNIYSRPHVNFASLFFLKKLVCLDLTATHINDGALITILQEYSNLQHLIIDLCENLKDLDYVVRAAVTYNTQLRTWSSWKTVSLTSEGIKHFSMFSNIIELDLGWCLATREPLDCLTFIANGCPLLTRLILSEWRGVSDQQLLPVIMKCKELTQLDLLGLLNITSEVCEKALVLLPKLRLLDVSYCENVKLEEVDIWRQQYPHITIQYSQ